MMLLGHNDELAVDTLFRCFVSKKYFNGQFPGDQAAMTLYQDWVRWKYLAYWFDIYSEHYANLETTDSMA